MSDEKIFAKCAWRLLPIMALLYVVNYIDRVNVGFAALTMNADRGFSPAVYGFAAGIFFFSYALSQVPANLILDRLGARRWIALILLSWGAISAGHALVQGPVSFYVLRFLLGVTEAGFFPGMIFYMTLWFPQSYRARIIARFYMAVPLAFIIGGPFSGIILGMDGVAGLHGWQWLFLIEGIPASVLAFAALKLLPDGPNSAPWLTAEEKQAIARGLAVGDRVEHQNAWLALRDMRVIVLGLANFGIGFGEYGLQLWLPQIVQAMGYSNTMTGLLVALPFAISIVALLVWARVSDRSGERFWYVALPVLLAAAGLFVASISQSNALSFVALTCAVVGLVVCVPPFWTLPSSFLGGSAAAAAIGLVRSIGAFGGFFGPSAVGVLRESTGGYAVPMAALGLAFVLTAIIILALGRAMASQTIPMVSKRSA